MKRFVMSLSLIMALIVYSLPSLAQEKWAGVDEAVIERLAGEHGREPREPLINTDQGDLLLFLFLLSGAVGGFVAGYYWRILMEGPRPGSRVGG